MSEFTIKLDSGKQVDCKVCSATTVEIHSDSIIQEQCDENGGIVSLDIGLGDRVISVGSELNIESSTIPSLYKIKYIRKLEDNRYTLRTHLRNKTSLYLLPAIGGDQDYFLYNYYLINAYLVKDHPGILLLKYRFSKHPTYLSMEETLRKNSNFVRHVDLDTDFVGYIFRVPDKHLEDIEHFTGGRYSQFSPALKGRIMIFHRLPANSVVAGILYKKSTLREMWEKILGMSINGYTELDSKPDMDSETINLSL